MRAMPGGIAVTEVVRIGDMATMILIGRRAWVVPGAKSVVDLRCWLRLSHRESLDCFTNEARAVQLP
jgi:hypothetical protein